MVDGCAFGIQTKPKLTALAALTIRKAFSPTTAFERAFCTTWKMARELALYILEIKISKLGWILQHNPQQDQWGSPIFSAHQKDSKDRVQLALAGLMCCTENPVQKLP